MIIIKYKETKVMTLIGNYNLIGVGLTSNEELGNDTAGGDELIWKKKSRVRVRVSKSIER